MRTAYLVCVTGDNHNKYYHMTERDDGTLCVEYGRVGVTKSSKVYPVERWDSLMRDKLRKGYVDQTVLFGTPAQLAPSTVVDDPLQRFLQRLMEYADGQISRSYTVASDGVTQARVDEAQDIIDTLLDIAKVDTNVERFNDGLLSLFTTIPRRMANVRDYLCGSVAQFQDVLAREQDTLDIMRGRVTIVQDRQQPLDSQDFANQLGISVREPKDTEIDAILKALGEERGRFVRAVGLEKPQSTLALAERIYNASNKDVRLLWHGSRNQNWWHILALGLVLRPANAIKTGAMFGHGLYFADRARKSLGYTSIDGSYWAHGSERSGFMGLFNVHLGNTLVAKYREYWHSSLTYDGLRKLGNYDSLSALAGRSLYNNEFIVYRQDQCTIKYLVEVKSK